MFVIEQPSIIIPIIFLIILNIYENLPCFFNKNHSNY